MQHRTLPCTQRHWLRYSVWALIVMVLVIGGGLAWSIRSADIQRDAGEGIKRAGGTVKYNWEWKNGSPVAKPRFWWPKWLVDLIGADCFGSITMVNLDRQVVSDSEWARMGRLSRLE